MSAQTGTSEVHAPDTAWDVEQSNFECWLHHNEQQLREDYEGECKSFDFWQATPFKDFAWDRYLELRP
jgi:hypothetical protein